jgi:hypothetical protein
MLKQRSMVLSIVAAVMVGGMPGVAVRAASNSEQVVFSGIGLPPVSSEPFGFWVWCQNEQAPNSRGRYETDCNGALYFYARGVVVHVVGEITEPDEGRYVMDLHTTDGVIECTLENVPPIRRGPNNTVLGHDCTVNGADVTGLMSVDAVVNATGP